MPFWSILSILALLVIFLRSQHARERDQMLLVKFPVIGRNPATRGVRQSKVGNILWDDGRIWCPRWETRHGVSTALLTSRSGAHLVPELRQPEPPSSDPPSCTVHVEQPAYTGMFCPDQELLPLEVEAEKKTGPDHGEAFSISRGFDFFLRDEAPDVLADRKDAFVTSLLQEGTADLDGPGVDIQDDETLMSGERQNRGRRQAFLEVLEGRQLGGTQWREHVREFLAGERGQGLGDVRLVLDEAQVHVHTCPGSS